MEFWIYLLAIGGLLCLAGVLVYARITSGKQDAGSALHHSPGNWRQSDDLPEEVDGERDENEVTLRIGTKTDSAQKQKTPSSEYLDELQEAAAGLALLMRSSPIPKAEPLEDVLDSTENAEATEVAVEIQQEESVEVAEAERAQAFVKEEVVFGIETETEVIETETKVLLEEEQCDEEVVEITPAAMVVAEVLLPVAPEVATAPKEEVVFPYETAPLPEIAKKSNQPFAVPVLATEFAIGTVETVTIGDGLEEVAEEAVETPEEAEVQTVRGVLGEALLARLDELDESLNEFEELLGGIESGFRLLSETEAKISDSDKEVAAVA